MTLPARPERDDTPPSHTDDPPSAIVWMIAGCALVLVYVAALALLRPGS